MWSSTLPPAPVKRTSSSCSTRSSAARPSSPSPPARSPTTSSPSGTPAAVRHAWPRFIYDALHAGLDPVLLFAPRRQAAEELAQQIAGALPNTHPLPLTLEQQQLAGPRLGKLLRARVAYHHSGLSYAQR